MVSFRRKILLKDSGQMSTQQLAVLQHYLSSRAATQDAVGKGSGENTELVAYCVPEDGKTLNEDEVRRFLTTRLPRHLLPSRILSVDKMPLLANGKVDRRSLSATLVDQPPQGAGRLPETSLERWTAAVWSSVLSVASVSTSDNFFLLGGNSLRAAQVVSRVEAVLSVPLPLNTLFEHPTLAEFASEVEHACAGLPDLDAVVEVAAEVYELPDEAVSAQLAEAGQ